MTFFFFNCLVTLPSDEEKLTGQPHAWLTSIYNYKDQKEFHFFYKTIYLESRIVEI